MNPGRLLLAASLTALPLTRSAAQSAPEIERRAAAVDPKVVAWRRDLHQHPELSNRETRTGKLVADHLEHSVWTCAIRLLTRASSVCSKGGRPGPVIALRADMDALPVTEEVDLPFKSTARAQYNGRGGGQRDAPAATCTRPCSWAPPRCSPG